jgi:LmbE family N-acetylglucosaminyl deacetylase
MTDARGRQLGMPRSEEAPQRDWGVVRAEELERIVVVSPHMDDAVLGLAQLLGAHPGATVVTVFAGAPDQYPDPMTWWDQLCGFAPGDDVIAARRDEDTKALAELGATPVWLDHVEHQYLPREEWVRAEDVVDSLEDAIRAADPTAVFMPFGLANPDHDETHKAARMVRERLPEPAWFCYEDHGYKHIPGMLAWRVAELFRARLWPTPAAPPVDGDQERKQTAMAHYRSQLLALEADWNYSAKLDAPEQCWRLASPPAGWEALSDG